MVGGGYRKEPQIGSYNSSKIKGGKITLSINNKVQTRRKSADNQLAVINPLEKRFPKNSKQSAHWGLIFLN